MRIRLGRSQVVLSPWVPDMYFGKSGAADQASAQRARRHHRWCHPTPAPSTVLFSNPCYCILRRPRIGYRLTLVGRAGGGGAVNHHDVLAGHRQPPEAQPLGRLSEAVGRQGHGTQPWGPKRGGAERGSTAAAGGRLGTPVNRHAGRRAGGRKRAWALGAHEWVGSCRATRQEGRPGVMVYDLRVEEASAAGWQL